MNPPVALVKSGEIEASASVKSVLLRPATIASAASTPASGGVIILTENGVEVHDQGDGEGKQPKVGRFSLGRCAYRGIIVTVRKQQLLIFFDFIGKVLVSLDVATGTEVAVSELITDGCVCCMAYCGGFVAVGTSKATMLLFEATSLQIIQTGSGRNSTRIGSSDILSLAFSGSSLITGSADGNVYCIGMDLSSVNWITRVAPALCYCCVISPDKMRVAAASDEVVKLLNIATGVAMAQFTVLTSAMSVHFLSLQQFVICEPNALSVWDVVATTKLHNLECPGVHTAVSADGTQIAAVGHNSKKVSIIRVAKQEEPQREPESKCLAQ